MVGLDRRRAVALRVTGPVLALAVGATWWLVFDPGAFRVTTSDLLLFGVAGVAAELLPMRQPRGRVVATSIAITAMVAMVGTDPFRTLLVALGSWLVAAAIRASDGHRPQLRELPVRLAGAWALAGIATLGSLISGDILWLSAEAGPYLVRSPGAVVAVVIAIVAGVPLVESLAPTARRTVPFVTRLRHRFSDSWLASVALAATAVLGAVVYDALGPVTVALTLLPLLAARIGLEKFTVISTAFDQTIRAMSRLPEELGVIDTGHGVRVGRLAVAVAHRLGLDDDEVLEVERAAHLHELGRIQLEPAEEPTPHDLAVAGASIIDEAGSLTDVAEVVRIHRDPQRRSSAAHPGARAARIVAASCDADHYAPNPSEPGQLDEVLVRLIREVGDIDIVAAVAQVIREDQAVSAV